MMVSAPESGDLKQVEEKKSGTGYLSQNDPRLHFGLGEGKRIDEVIVRWPSGVIQNLQNVEADKVLTITEPDE